MISSFSRKYSEDFFVDPGAYCIILFPMKNDKHYLHYNV